MATVYEIHPAIGIARVGNSPDEFFVGPERVGEVPEPAAGFKDAQCRVKRQAARFRIFARHDDGTSAEVTDADAEITWTVHLVNSKAAHPGRGNTQEPTADLTIDPGARTLTGPDQRALVDTGVVRFAGQPVVGVPLGEIRTDDDGRLLVLGGHGAAGSPAGNVIGGFWSNAGWYDDASDGPVSATITLRATGASPPVTGARVVVGPPKFAPHQNSVTTLYDRLLQRMVDLGRVPAPTTTSYTRDVHPILQRARDMRWVEGIFGAHSWPDPVTAQPLVDAIFARIGPGDMPRLNGTDSTLTPVQMGHLQRWKAGNYAADWAGPPVPEAAPSPDGMDRAALEACVGGAFFPGIEAGGLSDGDRPILESTYVAPFRLDPALAPGAISQAMALPWQADFKACADNWWPVPRPNDVIAQATGGQARWDRDVASMDEMVDKWHSLGFVVRQGTQHVEVEHCDEASTTLLTPGLRFAAVPQGPMGMVREVALAVVFEVVSPGSAVTLEYAPGGAPNHPQLVAVDTAVTVAPTAPDEVATARLWIVYRTGLAPSAIPTQTLTVRDAGSGRTWQVTVDADTVARRTTATALVLDRSGSMAEDGGDGRTKHALLQQAAGMFVDLVLDGDGIGVVRYDEDAQALQPVLPLGPGGLSDANRAATHDVIDGDALDPAGATSIGDGIAEGRALLSAAQGFDGTALVVLTDGIENSPRSIADAATGIDDRTYAVGLGQPHTISVPALQALSANTGGYLLVTGAITGDARFRLQKHFLQILSGVSAAEVVLDPDGVLAPGAVHRIPFQLSDADSGVEVVVLTPRPDQVDFRLQTPNGLLLEPWRAEADTGMRYLTGDGLLCYRVALPVQLRPGRFDQAGTWHAVLTIGEPRTERDPQDDDGVDLSVLRGRRAGVERPGTGRREFEFERAFAVAAAEGVAPTAARGQQRGLPYSLVVHAYSDVALRVRAGQRSFEPGAEVTVEATLTQSGLPTAGRVRAEVTRPHGTTAELVLDPVGPGEFVGRFIAEALGVHSVRVRARGRTRTGRPFTREHTATAAVWRGGDGPAPVPDPER